MFILGLLIPNVLVLGVFLNIAKLWELKRLTDYYYACIYFCVHIEIYIIKVDIFDYTYLMKQKYLFGMKIDLDTKLSNTKMVVVLVFQTDWNGTYIKIFLTE